MKAKLRSGKQGTKGIVKKYADGGLTAPPPALGTGGAGVLGGTTAPTQSALSSLSGSAMGTPQTPPPPMVGAGAPAPVRNYGGMGGRFGRGMGGDNRGDTGRPSMIRSGTGGPMPTATPTMGQPRDLRAMVPGSTVMPGGRAFKKGGMVGCDWSPKSAATMRGAARKGGKK